ncbi:MAG: phage portal protein [Pseudomonadota bacterium]
MGEIIEFKPRPTKARLAGGQSARRLRSWVPPLEHVNQAIRNGGETLLRRCRELETSNAYAARAARAWAGYAVRDGIRPTFQGPAAVQRRVRDAWSGFVECCDFDGCDTLWGIQELVAREAYVGGEAFIVKASSQEPLGLSLKIYQSEQLPLGRTVLDGANGNEVRDGIEFDETGRRTAYHFYTSHPGDQQMLSAATAGQTMRVPAEDVIHVYQRQNAGQIRGLSRFAAGMIRLHLLDGYDDAELDRQRVAAMFAAFITRPDDGDDGPMDGLAQSTTGMAATEDTSSDEGGVPIDLVPGLVQELEPGENIDFSDPPQLQGQYEAFQYRNLLAVSAAFGVPYHVLTGDVEKANYSSARTAQLDFRVEIGRFQQRCLIAQMARGIRRWFLEAATGTALLLPRDAQPAWTWNVPAWAWVDPKAEAEASVLEVNNGFTSRRRVVESRGHALEEIDEEIAADGFTPSEQEKDTPDDQDPT